LADIYISLPGDGILLGTIWRVEVNLIGISYFNYSSPKC